MAEQIYKLTPDRDLQCYFLTPSAIAAMSQANDSGFIVSGKWRQQFDWAVVEWNRDNVFEHPALRNLPDGDLSGLVLRYQEQRTGCIPMESNLYATVDWNNLRIWATPEGGTETVYHVPLAPLATPVADTYIPASATMTLSANPGAGNRVGVALLEEHYYYVVTDDNESLESIISGLVTGINGNYEIPASPDFVATASGTSIVITWRSDSPNYPTLLGANGNRIGVYGFAQGGAEVWQEPSTTFSGGQFPASYQITIDFGALKENPKLPIPTDRVRKLRWTWAADLQPATFQQTEFQVTISNWSVTGANRQYSVAGPGSRRIEDTDSSLAYTGSWNVESGNYSGSKIHWTQEPDDTCTIQYSETAQHELFVGSRLLASGGVMNVSIDGQAPQKFNLQLAGEDVLVRLPLGVIAAGEHSVVITNAGPVSTNVYFDFLEIAYPSTDLPEFSPQTQLALATDWDTYHSQSLAAERTAWLINKLGYNGRVNHYTGALWFYELVRTGTQYAVLTVTLTLTVDPETASPSPTVVLNLAASASSPVTSISHLLLLDDTAASVALALAALINLGTNLVWAEAVGDQLTITSRSMGAQGNGITVQLDPSSQGCALSGGSVLSGGVDGAPYDLDISDPLNSTLITAADYWRTDLTATPPINRAARDWHVGYFKALQGYGMDVVASFSTELMNGDPSDSVGIAQRYRDGTPVVLNTPSIQTNFSPTALAFWKQVYLEMASLQNQVGITPYLQFGEVQWWYYPKANIGMPFYDDYTVQQFQATYGVPMQTITSNNADPSLYPNETAFLPGLIGAYTAAIRATVQAQFPTCRFEVLYPTDTNNTPLDEIVNFPANDWTPLNLSCLKTESFTFTGSYNLDLSTISMNTSTIKGFANGQRSHLIGISDAWSSWMKEADIAQSQGLESIVLFALDQYCLIGYGAPPFVKLVRSQRQG